MAGPSHVPVLLDRVVALLAPALDHPGAVLVDCTLGLGGHSEAVLERLEHARVVGIDRDPAALELAGQRLRSFSTLASFGTALDVVMEELRIEHYFPADEATRRWFRNQIQ